MAVKGDVQKGFDIFAEGVAGRKLASNDIMKVSVTMTNDCIVGRR